MRAMLTLFASVAVAVAVAVITARHYSAVRPSDPPPRFSPSKVFPDGSSVTCVAIGPDDALLVWKDAEGVVEYVEGPLPLPEVPQ